jgi:hypothetical protein
LIADIGGTTTDIAFLHNGTPRLKKDGAFVGGWQTMVEAAEIRTCGLGGDSEVMPILRGRNGRAYPWPKTGNATILAGAALADIKRPSFAPA